MNKKTKSSSMSEESNHPYVKYEKTKVWKIINKSIKDLEENNDLSLSTPQEYIVGYLCEQLELEGLIIKR
jgi:hypothetical protein